MSNTTEILVTEKLYNGSPAKAESNKFAWFHGSDSYLKCKETGKYIYQMSYPEGRITDESVVKSVRDFWTELHKIQKNAEKEYEEKQHAEYVQKFTELNPRLVGLSHSEIQQKAKEWDDLHNEGEEGYNPYR